MKRLLMLVVSLAILVPAWANAADSLVRFEGGIGVIPVSRAAGTQNADGTFPDVLRNDVNGRPPGGQPWVIASLSVDVKRDGRISADGRGLLLAGGTNIIGTRGAANQQVRAILFCGGVAFSSDLVPLDENGDFRIDDVLKEGIAGTVVATLPDPCTTPVLLIVNAGGSWFAAGIPKRS